VIGSCATAGAFSEEAQASMPPTTLRREIKLNLGATMPIDYPLPD
jgi:hypothetical protein